MIDFKTLAIFVAALAVASPVQAGTADRTVDNDAAVKPQTELIAAPDLADRVSCNRERGLRDDDCNDATASTEACKAQSDSRDSRDSFDLRAHENSSRVWCEPIEVVPAGRAQSMKAQ